ncbi:hypothetical protein SAMN05421641_1056 [Paracoccus thiocyanatus]|uniref:Uncharacterized protein n=1 Tax=Paracoccus thiocyanatus TaxID=34006 RepID=A0A1N6R015_9RHOB|nr:hypothetical protein [Paracoccus thiocyanatus]SIQ22210.1 hypothetical protein SAMN05421641_1056 [Paracoccus thiocyanatus]
MSKPSWDASELARSALSELSERERADLMAQEFGKITDLQAICEARNLLTERASEIIADRYVDHLLGEVAA